VALETINGSTKAIPNVMLQIRNSASHSIQWHTVLLQSPLAVTALFHYVWQLTLSKDTSAVIITAHLLLYVVYVCEISLNFTDAFN